MKMSEGKRVTLGINFINTGIYQTFIFYIKFVDKL